MPLLLLSATIGHYLLLPADLCCICDYSIMLLFVIICYFLLLSFVINLYLLLSATIRNCPLLYIYMICYYQPWNPTSYIDLLLSATIYYYPLLSVITSCYRLLSCTTFWYMPLRIICNDLTLYVLICLPPGICYSPRWVSAIVYYCLLLPFVMNWAGAIWCY